MTSDLSREGNSQSGRDVLSSTAKTCGPIGSRPFDPEIWCLDVRQRAQLLRLYEEAKPIASDTANLEEELRHSNALVDKAEAELSALTRDGYYDESNFEDRSMQAVLMNRDAYMKLVEERDALRLMIIPQEEQLLKIAEECAVILCSSFAPTVHEKLPRELRDQVYDYLWTEDAVATFDATFSIHRTVPESSDGNKPSPDLTVPYFVDARFVGHNFGKESATWYFRMATRAEVHYCRVREYIQRNTFGGMDLTPINIIRRLTINIDWSLLRREEWSRSGLQSSMESLLTLEEHKKLKIEIYLSRDLQFSRTMFHVLEIIRPVFMELEQEGPKLKVMGYQFFAPKWKFKHPDIIPKPSYATVELLNYYFIGTPEEWLAMKAEEIKADPKEERREKCFQILETMQKNLKDVDALVIRGYPFGRSV